MKNEMNKEEEFQKKHVILPLMGTKDPPLNKDNSRTFELSSQPGTQGAATYKASVRILQGDEDLRSKLTWVKDCKAMLAGLHISTVDPALTLSSSVMSETCYGHLTIALDARAQLIQEAAIKQADEDNDNAAKAEAEGHDPSHYRTFDLVKEAISEVVRQNLPYKCLQKVKRHL